MMADTWNNNDERREDTAPVGENEKKNEQPVGDTPVSEEKTESVPFNGWSSDGSYRYVPPRGTASDPAGQSGTQTGAAPEASGASQQPAGQVPPQNTWSSAQNGAPQYHAPQNNGQPYGYQPQQQPWNAGRPQQAYYVPQQPQNGGKPPRKKSSGWLVAIAVIGALGVIAAIVCLGLAAMTATGSPNDPQTSTNVSAGDSSTPSSDTENKDAPSLSIRDWDDNDGGLSTREVVNRNLDSTVVLTIYSQSSSMTFGQSTLTKSGAASGIVMTADGYIITNRHCVVNENTGEKYARVDVTTHDGKTYEDAEVIGVDEATDLAVIRIKATGLAVAEFGKSSELAVGDRVIALGNAAGLSWTATQGIVSALARDVYDDTGYAIKCLQVDAAINPGNSGGPLLNNQGLVVGINSSKIVAEGYEGLGFSIPIDEAKTVIDQLLKYGRVRGRVALGITGQTVSSGVYSGFMIASIGDGSSLSGTDAAVGDLITAIDDTRVQSYGELRSELAKHAVGDQVTLTLMRSDRRTGNVTTFTVRVTLKEQTN